LRILALETTERLGSVAAAEDAKLLLEIDLEKFLRTAQSLTPAIKRLLAEVGWRPRDVELVATCIGPGSFTGLRVGIATAKTFAYAAKAEVLGIDTLEAIAASNPSKVGRISVAVDAQRGDVVFRGFSYNSEGWPLAEADEQLVPFQIWLDRLPHGTLVSGPALRKRQTPLPGQIQAIAREYWSPRASSVAQLTHYHFTEGHRDDLWRLLPRYSRRSAAEEKWEARHHPPQGKRSS